MICIVLLKKLHKAGTCNLVLQLLAGCGLAIVALPSMTPQEQGWLQIGKGYISCHY
jgi:hypothetical protein